MTNYLRILQPTPLYAAHDVNAFILKTLQPNELIPYNREKRRNKMNWMEVYQPDGSVAYIQKKGSFLNEGNFFDCQYVKMDDTHADGFAFSPKGDSTLHWAHLFFPQGTSTIDASNKGTLEVKSVGSDDKSKTYSITLEYDVNAVEVTPIRFGKGDHFYITYQSENNKDIFMQVDDLDGKKGFLLKKTNTSKLADAWLMPVAIVIMVLVVLAIIFAILQTGWLVISGLMIIPAVIVALVAVFAIQICLMILRGIFNQIRKRF